MTSKYNWDLIQDDYESGEFTHPELCEKYKIDKGYLSREAKKREWVRVPVNRSTKYRLLDGMFISQVAKDRYDLTKEKMGEELTVIDDTALVPLCNMYARMIELESVVKREGVTIFSKRTGSPYLNPNYTALLSATKTVSALGKELGLTLVSRKRAGIKDSEEKQDSFLDAIDTMTEYDNEFV